MSGTNKVFEVIMRIVKEGYVLPGFEICCKRSLGLMPKVKDEEWTEVVQLDVIRTVDGDEYELVAGITLSKNNFVPRINWLGVYNPGPYGSLSIENKNIKILFLVVGEEHVKTLVCPELLNILNDRIREFMK